LGTDRLVLRGIGERDTDDLADSLGDYETVYMLVYMPWPYDREHVQLYLENLNYSMGQGNAIYWAITLPTENRLMGVIGLTIEHEHSRATVHFWLGRKFWGKGYMTEAAKCVINYVFQGLNFNRLDVDLIAMNNRSQRVIEKCGFKFECEKEEYVKKEGKYENMKYYRLLRREYLTAQ
jgi:RimJ/RimL family protein N-acetyltransferase